MNIFGFALQRNTIAAGLRYRATLKSDTRTYRVYSNRRVVKQTPGTVEFIGGMEFHSDGSMRCGNNGRMVALWSGSDGRVHFHAMDSGR